MEPNTQETQELAYPIIVKRSPAQLGIQLFFVLTLTIVACLVILILGSILSSLLNSTWLTFPLITLMIIMVVAVNIGVTILAFLFWGSEYYELHQTEIIFAHGLLNKKRRSFPLEKVETIHVSQNFFERMFDFGDISLLNPVLPDNRRMRLLDVPHPQKYVDLIKSLQQKILENSPRSSPVLYTNSA